MTRLEFSPRVTYALGIAGLVPFLGPAMLLTLGLGPQAQMTSLINAYAFGIVCFLCGSWWGIGLERAGSALLVASNLVFLLAFTAYLFLPNWWPLGAALLLALIYLGENHSRLSPPFPVHYRTMRALLTLLAGLSMLLVHAAR